MIDSDDHVEPWMLAWMVCSLHAIYVLRLLCIENVWNIMCGGGATEKQLSRFRTMFSSSRCWNVNRICQDFTKYLDSSLSLLDDSLDYDIHFNSTNFVEIADNSSNKSKNACQSNVPISAIRRKIRTTFTSTRSVNCTTGTTKLPQLEVISGGGLPPWYRINPAGSSIKPSQFRMVWSLPVHFLRKLHGRQEGQTAWFSMNACLSVRFFSSNNCLRGLKWWETWWQGHILLFRCWRGTYSIIHMGEENQMWSFCHDWNSQCRYWEVRYQLQ